MFGNPQPIFFSNCFLAILLLEDRNFNGAELIHKSSLNDCAFVASVQAANVASSSTVCPMLKRGAILSCAVQDEDTELHERTRNQNGCGGRCVIVAGGWMDVDLE